MQAQDKMIEQNAPEIPSIAAELRQRQGARSIRALAVELGYDAGPGSALLSRILREQADTVSAARLADLRQRLGLDGPNEPCATAGSPLQGIRATTCTLQGVAVAREGGPRPLLPRWLVAATANLRRLAHRAESHR